MKSAKAYLEQAYHIDMEINHKLELMESMHALATKATSTYSMVPPSGTRNVHRLEDTLAKIIDMDNEINRSIDKLVDLKQEIIAKISKVEERELRMHYDALSKIQL